MKKKVKIFNKKNPPTGDKKDSKSGQLNHLLGGITLLEELNIPVEEVLKNNVRFFSYSTSTIRRNLEDFQLYGLEGKKTLSWLAATRVLDKIDIAIESNCLAYYQENLSKLLNIDLNLYRIKYFCKKLNNIPNPMADSRIFSTRFFKSEGKELHFLSSSFSQDANYGITVEETFDKYCASQPDIPNLDYYKAIIAAENNNKITDLVLNDYVIQQLDEFYQDPTNPLVYNFDGVIISRLKVLRYYQTLISRENISSSKEPLLYAITVLSMLDQEELQTINNCINKIRFLKKA